MLSLLLFWGLCLAVGVAIGLGLRLRKVRKQMFVVIGRATANVETLKHYHSKAAEERDALRDFVISMGRIANASTADERSELAKVALQSLKAVEALR